MDDFNNEAGIKSSLDLEKESNFSLETLEARALEELRNNKLKVLKPGLEIPREPK